MTVKITHVTVVGSRLRAQETSTVCSRCGRGMSDKVKARPRRSSPTCVDCRSVDPGWATR